MMTHNNIIMDFIQQCITLSSMQYTSIHVYIYMYSTRYIVVVCSSLCIVDLVYWDTTVIIKSHSQLVNCVIVISEVIVTLTIMLT